MKTNKENIKKGRKMEMWAPEFKPLTLKDAIPMTNLSQACSTDN